MHIISKTIVAIKVYSKSKMTMTRRDSVKHEVTILSSLNHESVVKFIDCFTDQQHVYLVLEFLRGKNLYLSLKERFKDIEPQISNKVIRKKFAKDIFRQLVSVLDYLHRNNVNHRDIKLDNIMYDHLTRKIKLIDFGFSKVVDRQAQERLSCGTPTYMSPEAILKEEADTLRADVWASGVVFYALMFLRFPFQGRDDKELY